ncbi:hypothetical protein EQF93_04400 [Helcococcus ovis]|uniref:SpaA isopeptide-forming pilin-related protein n=1 Tax=Helcococcus ovis TaxID=72026 RepID=UPI00106F2AEF|nr:SpaA isopeptide-forming pilin-related protein [Helcococcus ovis]TFF67836.1 hypothetical protein EQF93_04400 [Helcococcus ovis]WNZ02015.1 SpaA isopeptide-forming pilin-related protein [Helcococcus ovis]
MKIKKLAKRFLSFVLASSIFLSSCITDRILASGASIPQTNDIVIQKLEYKYSKLLRDDVLENKNSVGHAEVHSEIINNKDTNSLDTVATTRDKKLGELNNLTDEAIQNTGDVLDLTNLQTSYDVKKYSRKLYGEVEFAIFELDRRDQTLKELIPSQSYKLNMTAQEKKAFSQSQMKSAETVGNKIEQAYKNGNILPYGAKLIKKQFVDETGKTVFDKIPTYEDVKGVKEGRLYMIIETKAPKTVVSKAKPMFLYLPITNNDHISYKTTINLYPKNEVKEGVFGFQKYKDDGDGNLNTNNGALKGAKFKIYKGTPEQFKKAKALKNSNGEDIVVTTNEKGKLDITGIVRGQYFLVEIESDNLVDGMMIDATKYQKREGFKYLAGFDSLLNQYNILAFHMDQDGIVRTGSKFNAGKILNNINLLEYTNHFVPGFKKNLKSERKLEQGFDYFEDIPFELVFEIPDNIHEYSKFEAKDQLEKAGNIDMISDNFTPTIEAEYVKGKDGKIAFDVVTDKEIKLVRDKDYFVKEVNENNKFEISFVNPLKANMSAKDVTRENNRFSKNVLNAQKIYVRYHAQLKANATPDVLYNNKAEFTYNNAPEKGLTKDRYNHDGKKFQTFGYKFIKKDNGLFNKGLLKNTLEGAEFIIRNEEGLYFNGYKHNENATGGIEPVWVKYESDEIAYKELKNSKNHKDAIMISNSEGKFEVRGLKAGNYIAVEMKSPTGYRLSINPETKFTIKEKSFTQTTQRPLTITNEKSPEMPLTGSEELAIRYIKITLIFIVSLVVVLFVAKKRQKERNTR